MPWRIVGPIHIRPVFHELPAGTNRAWLLSRLRFDARPVSFRNTSHVTTMFTYQTPTRHVLLAVQKRADSQDTFVHGATCMANAVVSCAIVACNTLQ